MNGGIRLEIIIWIIIGSLFIASYIGIFIPIVPSVLIIWLGFLLYQFTIAVKGLPPSFWVMMSILTIALFLADFYANKYFVGKFGGSKWSEWGAIIGVVIGIFVYPPLGMLVIPFIIVLSIELIRKQPLRLASLAAVGALAGFLSGILAKIMMHSVMIIIFFIYLI